MRLDKLLSGIEHSLICGNTDIDISDICYDSRKAEAGKIFVALPGTNVDGHNFISSAYEKGARAFVVERDIELPKDCAVIKVSNCRKALALLSKNYFGDPSSKMTMIGITGTKGKSSITAILKTVLDLAGKSAGTIGTTGVFYADKQFATLNTTPESYETYRYISDMQKAGCTHVIMEVSSQGLMMHRVFGITFDYGVFTNLSPDHIGKGEHDSFEHYLECKAMLWNQTKKGIANIDDQHFSQITKNALCPITTFAVHNKADITADNISLFRDGKHLNVSFKCKTNKGDFSITTNVPGEFTVYNCLTAIAVSLEMGIDFDTIAKALSDISVKGRMELVGETKDYSIIIDYAHNAVSLETILKTIRQYNPKRIVCLFGCGGNRPKMRRFEMGETSGRLSDLSVITEDNSRFEDVMDIIEDIKTGLHKTDGKYVVVPKRKEAIRYCMLNAEDGDIIVLAGKGHEDYQEIKGVKYHMDERELIAEIIEEMKSQS